MAVVTTRLSCQDQDQITLGNPLNFGGTAASEVAVVVRQRI